MSIPTIIISIVLLGLFSQAIRFLVKNGACAACAEKGACHSAGEDAASSACGGNCSACRYRESELKAAAKHQAGQ
ncbi:hypothetical protein SAMN02745823_01825 [Sporobacter termitidis DSM 10068]|uniref:Uncharacterized protein n=1 Tax=Sporobacter termitidis DSM 10068 TaxID=1123282 RepID=A0A1M5XI24_9FIRM|nr:hypothetical protein [Sporobacter termitidis]SHH99282.1 hypothetical protein SAMN02745823_01825 [Sporobacter termitidis DSM 10068]